MDKRCPRKLDKFPDSPCSLAVQRLKLLAASGKNMPYLKEKSMEGCPYYILDKDSHYCFFKYMYDNESKEHSVIDICMLLNITQSAVYQSLKRAINKLKTKKSFQMVSKLRQKKACR